MDKDRVKGTIDHAVGRIKRQVGAWTGDTTAQVEGAAQELKGEAEKTWGKLKDVARDAKDEVQRERDREEEREPEQALDRGVV